MGKTISEAIAEIQGRIKDLEEQARPLKLQVNVLCEIDGLPALYPNVNEESPSTTKPMGLRIRVDEFTADKLGRAVRRYLEMRKEADPNNGPARIEDIKNALVEGGFDFRGKDPMQAVSVSVGKSTHTFKKVNEQGHIGLAEWYGIVRTKSKPTSTTSVNTDDDLDGEDGTEDQTDAQFSEPSKVEVNSD